MTEFDKLKAQKDAMLARQKTAQEVATEGTIEKLEEELIATRGEVVAQKAMVLSIIGGTVEGRPTGPHNYLQRLRELVAIEARCQLSPDEQGELDALYMRVSTRDAQLIGKFVARLRRSWRRDD